MKDIKTIIDELKSSPIYTMSLGSKELFHSNFWGWLIEHNNEYANIFFKSIHNGKLKVVREEKNRDITIEIDKKKYVIENKLKSIPTEKQLIKYTNDIGVNKFAGGILTGIKQPNITLPKGWEFLSYDKIADGILKQLDKKLENEFNDKIIRQYVNDIQNISELIKQYENITGKNIPNRNFSFVKSIEDKSIRLWDICQKYKMQEFVMYLENCKELVDLEKNVKSCGFELSFELGFSHSTAFMDVRFIRDREIDSEVSIGVQIQNGQYRKFSVLRGKNTTKTVYDTFLNHGWFENYNIQSKKVFNRESSMEKPYCSFENKSSAKYYFVNQHYKIYDNSFEALAKQIIIDMKQAAEIVSKNYKK